ncbi:hypothetical protein, partial [uncultured Haemophilus sp.]|uniref:hypothetical protein n=1 Tax=uncultured Haemophilus sp. TaxID=237779 RepID=UPI00280568C7
LKSKKERRTGFITFHNSASLCGAYYRDFQNPCKYFLQIIYRLLKIHTQKIKLRQQMVYFSPSFVN